MVLTGLSILLAVVLLNVHLYGSTLKPVSPRLRRILFRHLAPFLHVQLHRGRKFNSQEHSRCPTVITPPCTTIICNNIFLNEKDLVSNNQQQSSSHTFPSATMNEYNVDSDLSTTSVNPTTTQSFNEWQRLLTELNRLILRSNDTYEENSIILEWQNVALVIDRCLFLLYILLTISLTLGILIFAPLMKNVPKPQNYY